MVCIYCGGDTQVVNSRPQKRTNTVWRRRKCVRCSTLFSTDETVDYSLSIVVASHNTYTAFEKEKLLISLYEACRHRDDAVKDAAALTATVMSLTLRKLSGAVLERETLVRTAIEVLKRFDRAAAVQYEAFHPIRKG